jgi:hypothetical protein
MSHDSNTPHFSNPPWLYRPNDKQREVQIMKVFITQLQLKPPSRSKVKTFSWVLCSTAQHILLMLMSLLVLNPCPWRWSYSRITSTKSQSFYMTTFSARVTNLTSLLLQSRECSCYVNTPILAPPPLLLQEHRSLRSHDFAHYLHLCHLPGFFKINCTWSCRLHRINPAIAGLLKLRYKLTKYRI